MALNTDFSGAEMVALAGAVITGIAAFLPWAVAGVQAGPVDVSTSTSGLDSLGLLTGALAVIVLVVLLVMDWETQGTVATVVGGLGILLVGLWKLIDISGPVEPGIGLYLTVLGGIVIAGGGFLGYQGRRSGPGGGVAQ